MSDDRELTLADFPVHRQITTRWSDNDVFGHLNNAVYYQIFDTAINGWLGEATGIDPTRMPALGVVVENGCKYFREVGFPRPLTVGLAVSRVGNSSVTYRLGMFAGSDSDAEAGAVPEPIAALCTWTHVYVDLQTRRPVAIPAVIREQLAQVTITGSPT